jgi:hypothetical protein
MKSEKIYSTKPDLAELNGLISKIGWFRIFRNLDDSSKTMTVELDDWRTLLVCYLEIPSHIADRKVRRQALKYVMLDNTLSPNYRWFIVKMLGFGSI